MSHFLVVGLGNLPYPATRHSVGHLIIDALAARLGVSLVPDRASRGFKATKRDVAIDTRNVTLTLYKPKALMNISGRPVAEALRELDVAPSELVAIHDSLSHRPMTLCPKFGGSANGHNGVRGIISALGGNLDFHRLRVGIGRDDSDPAAYVLSSLSSTERAFWGRDGRGVDLVWRELSRIVTGPR